MNHYYLHITTDQRCFVEAQVNGFPSLYKAAFPHVQSVALISSVLTQGYNNLTFRFDAPSSPTDPVEGPLRLLIELKRYGSGEIVCPEDGHRLTLRTQDDNGREEDVTQLRRTLEVDESGRYTAQFEQYDHDYSALLVGPALPYDEGGLLAYGSHLLDLFASGDVDGFMAELEPKLIDFAHSRGLNAQAVIPQNRGFAITAMQAGFADRPAPESLNIRRWCGDRIFEIRAGNAPLIVTRDGPNGVFTIPAFVSLVNGQWRMVR